jgi:hypothetical protein
MNSRVGKTHTSPALTSGEATLRVQVPSLGKSGSSHPSATSISGYAPSVAEKRTFRPLHGCLSHGEVRAAQPPWSKTSGVPMLL